MLGATRPGPRMRSLIVFCTLLIMGGAFVARYADRAIVNSAHVQDHRQIIAEEPMARSSSMTTVIAPAAPPRPSPHIATPPKPSLPQVITLGPSARIVTLHGSRDGQFRVEARVDTLRIPFIVDTGAGAVALRESTASLLGFHPGQRDYTVTTNTANGTGKAAPVHLSTIEIDDIVVRDVRAIVVPDDALTENLLGMTFLSRVRWTHDRGKLVLEQQ